MELIVGGVLEIGTCSHDFVRHCPPPVTKTFMSKTPLLSGCCLSAFAKKCCAVALLVALPMPLVLAQRVSSSAPLDALEDDQVVTLAEIQVEAGQLQRHAYQGNMDLVRTENDIQPYSIIGRERIARSGATTVEDLLRQQLTMSTSFASSDNSPGGWTGSSSSFSLRGSGQSRDCRG